MRQTNIPLLVVMACAVSLVVIGGCRSKSAAVPGVWTTSSPREQGGLKLIAIQREVPKEVKVPPKHLDMHPKSSQFVWIDHVNRPGVQTNGGMPGDGIEFLLESADGRKEYVGAGGIQERYLIAVIPATYNPKDVGASLKAYHGSELLATWKLEGMPLPTRQIEESASTIDSFDAFGNTFKLSGPAICTRERSSWQSDYISTVCRAKFMCQGSLRSTGSSETFEVKDVSIRTTWNDTTSIPMRSLRLEPGKPVDLFFQRPFLRPGDIVEAKITLQRYRVLEEPIVLKNVEMMVNVGKRVTKDGKTDNVNVPVSGGLLNSYSVITPSGIDLTFGQTGTILMIDDKPLCVSVVSEQGFKDLNLTNSPLCKSTGKPVSIWLRDSSLDGNRPYLDPRMSKEKSENERIVNFALPANLKQGRNVLPEWKVVVIQKALVEEKTVTVRFPVTGDAFTVIEPKRRPKNLEQVVR